MTIKAICILYNNNHAIVGNVKFVQEGEKLEIAGNLSNLISESVFELNIHEFGDISNGIASTGHHFNPHKVKCGNFTDKIRHVGDLGELSSDIDGKLEISMEDETLVKLNGPTSIIGRSFVVMRKEQEAESELNTKTEENKNEVAFGVIGITK